MNNITEYQVRKLLEFQTFNGNLQNITTPIFYAVCTSGFLFCLLTFSAFWRNKDIRSQHNVLIFTFSVFMAVTCVMTLVYLVLSRNCIPCQSSHRTLQWVALTAWSTQTAIFLMPVLVAADKTVAVYKPYWYQKYVSGHRLAVTSVLLWGIPSLLADIPMVINMYRVESAFTIPFYFPKSYTFIFMVCYCLVLLYLAVSYACILHTASQHSKAITHLTKVGPAKNSPYAFQGQNEPVKFNRQGKRCAQALLSTYAVLNLPGVVALILSYLELNFKIKLAVGQVAQILIILNVTANGIIYSCLNTSFRNSHKSLFSFR